MKAKINGIENSITNHSSFQLDEEARAISKSQSISPVAFFSIIVASAFALATFASVFAFDFSTEPFNQVPANSETGPIRAVHISYLPCF
tara:strand:+ start:54570 stop:54836 length:267 start_codon:yes stop_codon:yes gene_type:complete